MRAGQKASSGKIIRNPGGGQCGDHRSGCERERGKSYPHPSRKNSLIRPAVANVDQAFVIFAMEDPSPNFLLLDRFLIMMEQAGIPAVICFNKQDLADREECERLGALYRNCGYRVILSSVREGIGVEDVRETLKGKTTVVAGPSGVGNLLLPIFFRIRSRWRPGRSAES